jgi:hypothetical protein
VVDVTDPTNPTEVGFYDTPGDTYGVSVSGGYVYVADQNGGLFILDPLVRVSLSAASLTFGSQEVGTTSAAQTITVESTGSLSVTVSNIESAGDFAYSHDCPLDPDILVVGATCAISVTFSPTITGLRTGLLTITDSAVGTPHTVSLTGTGSVGLVGVTIDGPAEGVISTTYAFVAVINPISATQPISYSWSPTPVSGQGTSAVSYSWPTTGTKMITVTAEGPANSVSGTLAVSITDTPIVGLAAVNDSPTRLGALTMLTATITGGSNVNYTWAFGDGAIGSGATVSHLYPAVGEYEAVVTATNSLSETAASTLVTIIPARARIYLPLIRK